MSAQILGYRRLRAVDPDPKKNGHRPAQVVALPLRPAKLVITRHDSDDLPPEAA